MAWWNLEQLLTPYFLFNRSIIVTPSSFKPASYPSTLESLRFYVSTYPCDSSIWIKPLLDRSSLFGPSSSNKVTFFLRFVHMVEISLGKGVKVWLFLSTFFECSFCSWWLLVGKTGGIGGFEPTLDGSGVHGWWSVSLAGSYCEPSVSGAKACLSEDDYRSFVWEEAWGSWWMIGLWFSAN